MPSTAPAIWTCTTSTGPWPGWVRNFRKTSRTGPRLFAPRTNKDLIEEALFARRRDLFSDLGHRILRHHLDLLRGRRRRDHRPARALEGSSSRPESDGGGHGAGPQRQSDCSEFWPWQHGRREEPGSHRGTPEDPVRNRIGLHRCRPRDDQRRDPGGRGVAEVAIHPGRAYEEFDGGQGGGGSRRPLCGR